MTKEQLQYQVDTAKRNLLVWLSEMERTGEDYSAQVKRESDLLAHYFLQLKGVDHV